MFLCMLCEYQRGTQAGTRMQLAHDSERGVENRAENREGGREKRGWRHGRYLASSAAGGGGGGGECWGGRRGGA